MSTHDLELAMKDMLGVTDLQRLPDGSGCFTMSMPLPDDHWLTKPVDYNNDADFVEPAPFLAYEAHRAQLIAAARWAIRGATQQGQITDFDPDAMVQNFVYALCGPAGSAHHVDDTTLNPDRMKFTGAQTRLLYDNVPAAQRDSTSFSAFSRIVDLVENAHNLLPAQARTTK